MSDLSILNVFEPKVRKNIIDFCKDLNDTKADIYIVMARKAACLISVLEKLSMLTLHGEVISERVLDCNIDWRKFKRVIIIDDVVISGTTLYQTINRIKLENSAIDIELYVLGVNKEWYNKDVLEYADGISYIHTPVRYFDNSECIRLSGDIVRMLARYPVPYNIDFPIYNTLRLNNADYNQIMSLPGWKVTEVTSFSHEKNDVFTYTFTPEFETLKNCGPIFLSDALQHSLLKIRTYCRCRTDKIEAYILTIVPMIIMPPLELKVLEDVFNELVGIQDDELHHILNSNTSRLRFVQFVLADLLARRFIQSINNLLCIDNSVVREYRSLRYLFPSTIIKRINEIADGFEGLLNVSISNKETKSTTSGVEVKELLDINDVLSRPFMEMYYKEELASRRLVMDYGKKVFHNSSYVDVINRLKRGISLTELINIVGSFGERKGRDYVSTFLDRAIDEGIVVPITVEKEGVVYRAFRHGEDVQFGQQEERLCYDMLSAFAKQIGRKDIPKLWMEKMMVLLFQLGEGEVFMPIQTSLESYNYYDGESNSNTAHVKYYLQGPLVLMSPKKNPYSKLYLNHKDKVDWMSSKMVDAPYSPVKVLESGMFTFDDRKYLELSIGDNQIVTDAKKTQFAKSLGLLFGFLLANNSLQKKPAINDDDLVMLTSSLETKNVIGAMAAEINICFKQFFLQHPKGICSVLENIIYNNLNPYEGFEFIRKSKWYQALNDGVRKFTWYCDKKGYSIINRITAQFEDELYKTIWENLWSPNMEQRGNSEKSQVVDLAIAEGLWLSCVHTYYLMLFCLIDDNNEKRSESIGRINDLYFFLNRYNNNFNARYVKDIIPIVAEFLERHNEKQYVSVNVPKIFERLIVLFKRCQNLLKKANVYYMNTLEIPKSKSFNHVLYIETLAKNDIEIINRLYEGIRFNSRKSVERTAELLLLNNSDGDLSLTANQCIIVAHGENGLYWLLWAAAKANSSFRGIGNLRMVLYANLHLDCQIKYLSNARFETQLFADLLCYSTLKIINTIPFNTDSLYVLSEGNKDIRSLNQCFKNHQQVYIDEHALYLPNKRNFKLIKYQHMDNNLYQKADIGIITIVDEEANAVRKGFNMDVNNPQILNNRYYDVAEFSVKDKSFNIVHLQCSNQGNIPMAVATIEMIKYFNPDRIVLLGIAGGIKDNLSIGDVVIANDVIYYESRKEKDNGLEERRGKTFTISNRMNSQIVRYRSLWNYDADSHNTPPQHFSLHVAPIGAGEVVISNSLSTIKQWLLLVNNKTCAVETEAAGFSAALYETSNDAIDYLIIRGISDKADSDKNDDYRKLASENAVFVLKDFIEKIFSGVK